MADRLIARRRVGKLRPEGITDTADDLAVEEPMEIRVDSQTVAITMRTPGDDFELALGFCLTEGIVAAADDVATIRYCPDPRAEQTYNVVDVRRRSPGLVPDHLRRNVYTSSSCGICGTASIDAVRERTGDVSTDGVSVRTPILAELPGRLARAQRVFARTGGLHAAGLFDAEGAVLCVREDVGRHNAVDKVIGWAAREGRLPLEGTILLVSGRVAFEIVQKALTAAIPVVAAVSAPTSLAVAAADTAGMTLVGFVRDASLNIYAGAHRVVHP
jgi:FdhD protein